MKNISFVLALALLTLFASRASAADPPVRRRVGIVVGANTPPPGGSALRFAYEDAREMADVLTRAGHFAPADVHLLLDPTPADLLREVDDVARSADADTLVLFYYSGHADAQSLYPDGEALRVTEVRGRLSSMAARARVGVFDTWHEGDDARGSSFTHDFASGLLGGADTNGDGNVTLAEALARAPEYSSLDVQVEGAPDIVLASPRENASAFDQAPRLSSLSLWGATPGQRWLLHLGVGMGTQYWPLANGGANAATGRYSDGVSFGGQLWYRITDRLSWNVPFPAFSYRFGDPGSVEVMPSMGLKLNSWSASAGPSFGFSTDVNALIWTAPNQRITLGAGVYLPAYGDTTSPLIAGIGMGNDVDPSVRGGYSWTIKHTVTLHAELGYVQDYYRGTLSNAWLQPRGGVDIRVSPNASLNFGALYSDEVHQNLGSYENFSVGTTIAF